MQDIGYIEIPLFGKWGKDKSTLVDADYDGEYFSQYKWYVTPDGYAVRDGRIDTQNTKPYIYLHHEVGRPTKGMWVDHINRNKLDNRSCNIRLVTPSQSAKNRHQPSRGRGTNRYRGVTFHKRGSYERWQARCAHKYLGLYKSELDAARRYDEYAKQLWGNDAVLNLQ